MGGPGYMDPVPGRGLGVQWVPEEEEEQGGRALQGEGGSTCVFCYI